MRRAIALAMAISFSTAGFAQSEEGSPLTLAVNKALESDIRSDKEKARDKNRKPLKTLEFFEIEPTMKVLEIFPGGGWYTKVLAPVLKDEGELHVALGTRRVSEKLIGQVDGFDKVKVLDIAVDFDKGELAGTNSISEFEFKEKGFDAALTFRNMHNFDAPSRKIINQQVFKSLKKGGIYGIVDHTRRHMEPHTLENRRRADPVEIIKELLDLGFEFDGFSDLHYRADDELRYEVGRKSVTGNTDRFTLLFRKPN
ncbi:class I SAM-dependent methyltransferase [Arenicella sp. 4NH20-0111]|uniref:class I SAM-dependent methyltransferase n=1 Tax=Arenicella sp. 4NH20-0111 TaxID=3127648 RepID=UPI0031054AEB